MAEKKKVQAKLKKTNEDLEEMWNEKYINCFISLSLFSHQMQQKYEKLQDIK